MIVTDHAEHRQKQRNIPQAAVDYILKHGEVRRKRDAIHYILTRDHLVGLPRQHEAHRYYGIRVIVSRDSRTVITTYWEAHRPCRHTNASARRRDRRFWQDEAS
jgi:hypothetical protein